MLLCSRALEIYNESGVTMTTLLAEQHAQSGADDIRGPLRYPNVCIIWIRCDKQGEQCSIATHTVADIIVLPF